MRLRPRPEDKVDLGMAPMIDAVFLLLIFFLVATMLKKVDRDIDVTPPQSESAVRRPAEDKSLVIGISKEGDLFLDGEPASVNGLHLSLRELAEIDATRQIRLDADEAAPFRRVAEVMDACQFRNLSNVVIRTYDEKYNTK